MNLRAWRIVKAKHATTAFSGEAARSYGGRWNSPGMPVIYTAGSISLAMLEMLTYLELQELLSRYVLFEVGFDEGLPHAIDPKTLPRNWRRFPASRALHQRGDTWLAEEKSVVLRVPSAIVPTESNYLLNPRHPDFAQIVIGPKQHVRFDARLIKAQTGKRP